MSTETQRDRSAFRLGIEEGKRRCATVLLIAAGEHPSFDRAAQFIEDNVPEDVTPGEEIWPATPAPSDVQC